MRAADTFHFQAFSVSQDRCAMKVGTDGVLLGAWATLPTISDRPAKVVDIGTGTGLIALMLAQRLAQAGQAFEISALEPEPLAAAQAKENITQSAWSHQIQVSRHALATAPLGLADLWICNPPFFEQARVSAQAERAQARHSAPHFISTLFERASQHVTPAGRLALVLPQDRTDAYLTAAQHAGWQWQRRCWVRHSLQHPIKRVLLEFTPTTAHAAPPIHAKAAAETQTLCLKVPGPNGWQDSTDYARWVSPFYLRYRHAQPPAAVSS